MCNYTLNYTLHITHYTLHITHLKQLHISRYTLHISRYTLHITHYTLHINTTHYTLSYTLHITHYTCVSLALCTQLLWSAIKAFFLLIVFFLSTVEKQDEIGSTNLCFNTPIKLEEPKSTISHCHLEKIEEKIESLI